MAKQTISGGIGFPGALTIVFVILKALGYLNWSWWWVFSPLWIGTGIAIIFASIALTLYFITK